MSPERTFKARSSAKRFGVEFEEERTWVSFYERVPHDATLATEVLAQLEADPELRRQRSALYLRCKESARRCKARQQRDRRIGRFVRRTLDALLVEPVRALCRGLQQGWSLAIECLPETGQEASAPSMRTLRRGPQRVPTAPATAEPVEPRGKVA